MQGAALGKGVSWIRRTRIDGDPWADLDVPLGEDTEAYLIQSIVAGETVRVETVQEPYWDYTNAMLDEDGVTAAFSIRVSQVSDRFGAGPALVIEGVR